MDTFEKMMAAEGVNPMKDDFMEMVNFIQHHPFRGSCAPSMRPDTASPGRGSHFSNSADTHE